MITVSKTLGSVGFEQVKYEDVVSGGNLMTILVHITGGRNATLQPPFLSFQNRDRNYPIRNVPDYVPGVSYRMQLRGWMVQQVFPFQISSRFYFSLSIFLKDFLFHTS